MKTIRDVIVTIDRAFQEDPRPSCFRCLSVVSQGLSEEVERHIRQNLNRTYVVEDGICRRRDHQARIVRLRNGG